MDKSTLISIGASIGVIGTAISAAKAAPKAQERIKNAEEEKGEKLTTQETVVAALPAYIPPALFAFGTITSILGANALNQGGQASLISSYAVLEQCYRQYRDSLIELHGPAADEEVREHMGAVRAYSLHESCLDRPDYITRWYEPISDQWFEAYEREVMDAEYHFNRNYTLGFGTQTVNNYLYFLNLPDMGEEGDRFGWCAEDGIQWIDFEHEEKEDEHGIYYVVSACWPPANIEEYL